jgi:hypothetical protein
MDEKTFLGMFDGKSKSECWPWPGCISKGYGEVWFMGKHRKAHVLAWLLLRGPIPAGFELDHLCRNKACCNPSHLEPVTHKENCMRGISFSAKNAKITHCPDGHEYTEENTYYFSRHGNKYRRCKICHNERRKRQHENARARYVLQFRRLIP